MTRRSIPRSRLRRQIGSPPFLMSSHSPRSRKSSIRSSAVSMYRAFKGPPLKISPTVACALTHATSLKCYPASFANGLRPLASLIVRAAAYNSAPAEDIAMGFCVADQCSIVYSPMSRAPPLVDFRAGPIRMRKGMDDSASTSERESQHHVAHMRCRHGPRRFFRSILKVPLFRLVRLRRRCISLFAPPHRAGLPNTRTWGCTPAHAGLHSTECGQSVTSPSHVLLYLQCIP